MDATNNNNNSNMTGEAPSAGTGQTPSDQMGGVAGDPFATLQNGEAGT